MLMRIDVFMGSYEPCVPFTGTISIVKGLFNPNTYASADVLYEQQVSTTCDSCVLSENTCLLAPACNHKACAAWQEWTLKDVLDTPTPLHVTGDEVYSFVLDGFRDSGAGRIASVGVAVGANNQGGRSSLVVSAHVFPAFTNYVFRTFMSQSNSSVVFANGPNGSDEAQNASQSSSTSTLSGAAIAGIVVGITALGLVVILILLRRAHKTNSKVLSSQEAACDVSTPASGKVAWNIDAFTPIASSVGSEMRPRRQIASGDLHPFDVVSAQYSAKKQLSFVQLTPSTESDPFFIEESTSI
jgi:hypothetical protein